MCIDVFDRDETFDPSIDAIFRIEAGQLRTKLIEYYEEVPGHLDYKIISTLKLNGFLHNEIVTDTWIKAYRAPFPTAAHSVSGIGWAKGYATGAHQFENPDPTAKATILEKPALAIWGEQDRTLHAKHFQPLFRQLFLKAQVHRLPGAGHYNHEDEPDEITQLVIDFLKKSQMRCIWSASELSPL